MWDRWRNWAKNHATSFFQSAEWAETLVRHYPFYRPEPIFDDSFFLPLIRHHRHGWVTDSLYGMPLMSTGGILAEPINLASAWEQAGKLLRKKQVGTTVLCLPPASLEPFAPQGFERIEQTTHLIDLSDGWDVVYSKFNKSCKEAIRRGERLDVQIAREEDDSGFEAHWELIRQQFEKWKPNPPMTQSFIRDLVNLEQSRLYVARVDGRPVLSMLAFAYGHEVFLWQSAKVTNDFPPGTSNLLTSTLFREAGEEGFHTVNFGTSLGNPKIERYKEAYGAVRSPCMILKKVHPCLRMFR